MKTTGAIGTVRESFFISDRWKRRPLVCASADILQCYDQVLQGRTWEGLLAMGVPTWIVRAIAREHVAVKARATVRGAEAIEDLPIHESHENGRDRGPRHPALLTAVGIRASGRTMKGGRFVAGGSCRKSPKSSTCT